MSNSVIYLSKVKPMRVLYLIGFILFCLAADVSSDDQDDAFVTVIAPKSVYEQKDYNLVLIPNNVEKRTEVGFNFFRSYATIALHQEKMQKFSIKNSKTTGSKKLFDLKMVLLRNATKSGKTQAKCISQNIQGINSVKDQFYTFIQTDKPIYKPGDHVRFRVLILDKDLKPFHINTLSVNITDPLDHIIKSFNDPGTKFAGVFNETFKLSSVTALGIWKIHVIIDKKPQFLTVKPFNVQKYTLPPFNVHLESNYQHLMTNTLLELKFYGRYSFGEYVPGNVQLTIREAGINKNRVYWSTTYNNVNGVITKKFRTHEDLRIITSTEVALEAEVIFTEAESGIVASKKITFTVHGNTDKKILVNPDKFMAGMPYGIKVSVRNWDHTIIKSSPDNINVNYDIQTSDGTTSSISADLKIVNGIVTHAFVVPENAIELILRIKFISTTFEQKLEMGKITVSESKIKVFHRPTNPKFKDNVEIFVKSDTDLDQIIAMVMTRHGSVSSIQQRCNYQKICKFGFEISKDMMPKAKVVVYYVEGHSTLHRGETTIRTEDLSGNYLTLNVPEVSKIRETIDVSFSTRKKSDVYLLAIDKRLTYLGTDNEVNKADVVSKLIDYDGDNEVRGYKLENWHDCTPDDLKIINKGRQLVSVHGGEHFSANEDFDESEFDVVDETGPEPTDTAKGEEKDEIRENFPEVWIFDDFKASSGNFTRSYNTTDSITAWKFTAFSMNNEYGLAIAEPKELKVKKPFFLRTNFPYSIRYNEVLKLDILLHNYLPTKEDLSVTVDLHNINGKEFQFVNYNGCSITSTNNDLKSSKNITVPFDLVKKVTFYVRSYTSPGRSEYLKMIKFRVDATATTRDGVEVKDKILKKLKVDPIGVKMYEIKNLNYQLTGKERVDVNVLNMTKELHENVDEFPKIRLEIEGDFLSDTINVSPSFEFYPSGCTEQRTSKIKAFVEYVKYLLAKKRPIPSASYNEHYQGLLYSRRSSNSYIMYSEFKSYYIETLASAMIIKIFPEDKLMIQQELDQLKALQENSGTFRNHAGYIPSLRGGQPGLYFQTAYCLIPFVKFKTWIGKNYDDVIRKGMNYLKDANRINEQDYARDGLVMAAYIFALNGDKAMATEFLQTAEKDAHFPDSQNKNIRCLKRYYGESCDLRHTAFASLTYQILDMPNKARPLIAWLLTNHRFNQAFVNSIYMGISAETISMFVQKMNPKKPTDFTVKITNEHNFEKIIKMTTNDMYKTIAVEVPDYSLKYTTTAKGNGYCTITSVVEKTIAVADTHSKFKLKINPKRGSLSNERIVEVCATYDALDDGQSLQTLVNVIYDVDLPSGYQYVEVINLTTKKEISIVEPKNQNTKVQIYYNDFKKDVRYCADVKVKKVNNVLDIKQAGVKVYDYEDKTNVAVDFYKFDDNCSRK